MGHFVGEDLPWWSPGTFPLALVTALVSTACWGSWSNTAKAAGDRVNFAHYYTDFCLGTVLTALFFFGALGHWELGREHVDTARAWYAVAAGAVFGVANLLLTTGIALAGLSIAFPLCIGTGLVLGTTLTYFVDPRGHPELIFPGVLLALLGVMANARAYAKLQAIRGKELELNPSSEESGSSDASDTECTTTMTETTATSFTKNVTLCIVGGLLMGCWAPLSTKSMDGDEGLSPYLSFLCFVCSSMLVGVTILTGQQAGCSLIPRVGAVTGAREYLKLSPTLHAWGLLGGFIWAVGTLANLVSGGPLGFALSYALGQSAPVVAMVWGLAWYREFDGAPRQAVVYLVAMFVLFFAAIALLCLGGN